MSSWLRSRYSDIETSQIANQIVSSFLFFSFFYKSKKFKTNDIYPCIQKILKIHISLYRSNNSFQVCCQDIFSIKQSKNRRYNIFYTNNTKYREYKSNSSLQPSPKSGQ